MKTSLNKYLFIFFIFLVIFINIVNIRDNFFLENTEYFDETEKEREKEKVLWIVETYDFNREKNKLIEKIYKELSQKTSVKLVIFSHTKNTKTTKYWDKKTVVLVFPYNNQKEALKSNYKTYVYSLSQEYESLIVSDDNSELSFDKVNEMIEVKK